MTIQFSTSPAGYAATSKYFYIYDSNPSPYLTIEVVPEYRFSTGLFDPVIGGTFYFADALNPSNPDARDVAIDFQTEIVVPPNFVDPVSLGGEPGSSVEIRFSPNTPASVSNAGLPGSLVRLGAFEFRLFGEDGEEYVEPQFVDPITVIFRPFTIHGFPADWTGLRGDWFDPLSYNPRLGVYERDDSAVTVDTTNRWISFEVSHFSSWMVGEASDDWAGWGQHVWGVVGPAWEWLFGTDPNGNPVNPPARPNPRPAPRPVPKPGQDNNPPTNARAGVVITQTGTECVTGPSASSVYCGGFNSSSSKKLSESSSVSVSGGFENALEAKAGSKAKAPLLGEIAWEVTGGRKWGRDNGGSWIIANEVSRSTEGGQPILQSNKRAFKCYNGLVMYITKYVDYEVSIGGDLIGTIKVPKDMSLEGTLTWSSGCGEDCEGSGPDKDYAEPQKGK